MKIGIISYWDTQHNYGQLLQCYAMQQLVKKLGHEPKHIRYKGTRKSLISRVKYLLEIICSGHLFSYIKLWRKSKATEKMWKIMESEVNTVDRNFDDFRTNYLSFTEKIYSDEDLEKHPPLFDAYFCGSDQIWSAPSKPYMLQFGPKKSKRLAIAASMGGIRIENSYHKYLYKKYLKKFDYISLREDGGTKEIMRLGSYKAETFPDPTLVLEKDSFMPILKEPKNENYVFVYLLGNKMNFSIDLIYDWAKVKGLEVIYVATQGLNDSKEKVFPSINEWLGYINKARYVITNSFHGMAFSIIFEKQFLIIPLIEEFARMNDRVIDVLSEYGLKSRLYSGSFQELPQAIDYSFITKKRLERGEYLLNRIDTILNTSDHNRK